MTACPLVAVVDDDGSVRMALGRLLRSAGLQAVLLSSGHELLADPRLHRIACVVSDIRMPGFSGFDLFDALRARGLETPTILMTAYASDADEQRARLCGSARFLRKPFAETELMRCIEDALGQARRAPAR